LFSSLVIRVPLRGYQIDPADAVIQSCLRGLGREFLWVFPRQSGKDEAVAQVCAFLLSLFQRVEAGIVHVYPTGAQVAVGVSRLEHRLENAWWAGRWWRKSPPIRRGLGSAQVSFFSGHAQAKAEGATANLLLIVNEVQDQEERVIERRFTPMRASANATALYVGTVRTTGDYLWKVKERLERLEISDGIKRVFFVSPYQVGAENASYLEFVEAQVRLKGRQHPAVKTEFFNEPVDVMAGLFPARRRALMAGAHPRLRVPQPGEVYVALVDVGGQDEAGTQAESLSSPGRDYTVCTIVRVRRDRTTDDRRPTTAAEIGGGPPSSVVGPTYQVVDVFVDHGSRHFQAAPGKPSLFERLLAYLMHWNAAAVVCDMTGVGQGITDALIRAYPRQVIGFDFARAYAKARLGNDFLSIVETGRFHYFRDERPAGQDGLDATTPGEGSDAWWFFTQAEHCGYELAQGAPIERGLRWGVSPSARVVMTGDRGQMSAVPVHDDRLLSAALVAEVDRLIREGKLFVSSGESAVIRTTVDGPQAPTTEKDWRSSARSGHGAGVSGRWS
jgi:hypothetical protein